MLRAMAVCILVAVAVVGCGNAQGEEGGSGKVITVFGAVSLTDAFEELRKDFEAQHEGAQVKLSFGGSSTLLAQLQQGAPADVFASADKAKMEAAVSEGLVAGEPEVFVKNREVVIVPKENPAGIESFEDLQKPGTRIVLAQDEVPAAEYAKDILKKAADDSQYGPDFREAVLGNIVSREADVRASVNRVALNDADATFGYASDVTPDIEDRVKVIEIPENLNEVATYPIAVMESSSNKELSRQWEEFVLSDHGQEVLKKWGFMPVNQ